VMDSDQGPNRAVVLTGLPVEYAAVRVHLTGIQGKMRSSVLCAIVALVSVPTRADDAKDVNPDEIIQKFAAKETAFARARENYTYRQTVKIQTITDSDAVDGRYEIVEDIIFSPDGKRTEKVVRAPVSTLVRLQLSPEDLEDLRNVQPFVLTTNEIPQYDIRYLKLFSRVTARWPDRSKVSDILQASFISTAVLAQARVLLRLFVERKQLIGTHEDVLRPDTFGDLFRHANLREPVCQKYVKESRARGGRPFPDFADHETLRLFAAVRRKRQIARPAIDAAKNGLIRSPGDQVLLGGGVSSAIVRYDAFDAGHSRDLFQTLSSHLRKSRHHRGVDFRPVNS
jgi:hypothetical protein